MECSTDTRYTHEACPGKNGATAATVVYKQALFEGKAWYLSIIIHWAQGIGDTKNNEHMRLWHVKQLVACSIRGYFLQRGRVSFPPANLQTVRYR